jgi:exopolyphosphatase/guanosine-5'-triphosphate,3'-diphosphate pyrophosphatase
VVKILAAILRVADGLDRNRMSYIKRLRVVIKNKSLTIKLKRLKDKPLELDIWGAKRKKDLLEKVLNRKVKIA